MKQRALKCLLIYWLHQPLVKNYDILMKLKIPNPAVTLAYVRSQLQPDNGKGVM